ncbi:MULTISPECIES: RsiV family protein [unclassified Moraxella]|uniref:RsiV family protein n=1 Tax=unclassified Moraxella TaxID=2685852 RepID=UPI003AF71744
MKKSLLTSIILASFSLLSSQAVLAKPTPFAFQTVKFDYKIPPKLDALCKQRYNALPKEDRTDNEYCMRVDIDLVKTNYPFIDNVINENFVTEAEQAEMRASFDEDAEYAYEYLQDKKNTQFNQSDTSTLVKLVSTSPKVVQISQEGYEYGGGPHGMPSMGFYVFDLEKQKQLKVDDILVSPSKKTALEKLVFAQFKNWVKKSYVENGDKLTEQAFADYQKTWKFELNDNFYFTPQGMTFSYNPYSLGAYAIGFAILNIDKKDLKGIVKDAYLNQNFDKFDDDNWNKPE